MVTIFLSIIISFATIYFAVRLAISPLINKSDVNDTSNRNIELTKLRDIGVLSSSELEEAIELFEKKSNEEDEQDQYNNYVKVLNELNNNGFLNDEERLSRLNKLKDYFKIK